MTERGFTTLNSVNITYLLTYLLT